MKIDLREPGEDPLVVEIRHMDISDGMKESLISQIRSAREAIRAKAFAEESRKHA